MEGLAFYWNCGTTTYGNLPTVDIIHHLTNEIATKTSQPENYRYSKQCSELVLKLILINLIF